MYRTNFLIGATIGIMTALLVINMPHPVKASTCSASASAGGVANNKRILDFALQFRQQTRDQGCSSASVAVGGPSGGTACGAANNGGGGIGTSGGSSCSINNHNQFAAQPPSAQAAPAARAK